MTTTGKKAKYVIAIGHILKFASLTIPNDLERKC